MEMEKLIKLKELLDSGAITQEEFDGQKQQIMEEMKAPKKKKVNIGLIVGIAVVFFICVGIIGGSTGENEETEPASASADIHANATQTPKIPAEFQGECPVSLSASLYDNIIGVPELSCTFKNLTEKEIAAIQIYFSPKDVYGEAVNTIFTANKMYTDTPIDAGGSSSRAWQMLDQEIKSGELYIYSVYFTDGTQWGNKDAATSDIKKYAYQISVKY